MRANRNDSDFVPTARPNLRRALVAAILTGAAIAGCTSLPRMPPGVDGGDAGVDAADATTMGSDTGTPDGAGGSAGITDASDAAAAGDVPMPAPALWDDPSALWDSATWND
ncbi:MAG TPA: hypothetical protein VGF45_14965 [Polyangia bacterium]